MRLADKVAIVTGAGRGLGRAIASRLASEGARVVVDDVNLGAAQEVVERIVEAGGEAWPVVADVSVEAQVTDAEHQLEGRLSLLSGCHSFYG